MHDNSANPLEDTIISELRQRGGAAYLSELLPQFRQNTELYLAFFEKLREMKDQGIVLYDGPLGDPLNPNPLIRLAAP